MSNICKTELLSIVQENANRITSCDSTEDILFSVKSVNDALWKDGGPRITKTTINNLPMASDFANGHVAYLEDAKIPVIASNGTWITVDGRTINTNNDNQIWSWGDGRGGEIGDGTTLNRCSPVREFSSSTNWCQISVDGFQSAIKSDGSLWNWGYGSNGRLADGTTVDKCSPVREISSSTNWKLTSPGGLWGSAIKTDGTLWSWGEAISGKLGNGTTTPNTCSPVREITSSTNWCFVNNGRFHANAIKADGSLWSWGSQDDGRLGDGTTTPKCSPVREISSSVNWNSVAAGNFHTIGLKADGTLWGWGFNSAGQLGNGTVSDVCSPVREVCSSTNWCQIAAGRCHSAAIKTNGTLWSWGKNNCGELGNGSTLNSCSPIQEFCSATNWLQVGSGSCVSLAIKTDGTLWGWGCNWFYALGDGTDISRCSPVREISSSTDWCSVAVGFSGMAIKSIQTLCR